MSAKLTELRGTLEDRRAKLAGIFQEAGDDLDMSNVKSLEGDSTAKVEAIRNLNNEIDDLHKQVKAEEELVEIKKRTAALSETQPHPGHPVDEDREQKKRNIFEGKSLGDLIVESPAFKGYQPGSGMGPVHRFDIGARELKTLFQTSAGWSPESVRTGIVSLFATRPAPHVVDFIPEASTRQAAVKYMEETTFTNNAAEAAEAAAYGEGALALTERSKTVRKIAVWLPVTDEQLEDEEEARDYINNRLVFMLRQRLDSQVLVGDNSAPNLEGTENVSGIQTQALGTDPIFDAAFKLFRKIRDDGFAEPSVAFIRPSKWETVRLSRTADGIYLLGNPADAGPERLWGVPVVQTTAPTATKLVAGDYANHSALYVRRGVDVQVGYQSDDFIKGRLAIRADLRVAMVHYRPKAFGNVTGL